MSANSLLGSRKNIINLASLWTAILLFISIVSLFSIWSMNKEYLQSEKITTNLSNLRYEVRAAQIDFKSQVQEWKNILLRGKEQDQREKYFSAFQASEMLVAKHFQKAIKMCSLIVLGAECNSIKMLSDEHSKLGVVYRINLEGVSLDNYQSITKTDLDVKVIDRKLQSNVDKLAERIFALEKSNISQIKLRLIDRYEILRQTILISIVISMLILGISLYNVLSRFKSN